MSPSYIDVHRQRQVRPRQLLIHRFDHALRRDEDLAAARYVVTNPVRRGLVERVADYPHRDAIWLEEASPIGDPSDGP